MFDYHTNTGPKKDFKLRPGLEWAKDVGEIKPISENLAKSINNFRINLDRLDRLASIEELPSIFVSTTIVAQTALANARVHFAIFGGPLDEEERKKFFLSQMNGEVDKLNAALPRKNDDNLSEDYKILIKNTYYEIQRICQHFISAGSAMNDLFAAQITGFWTAFEVFSADLWEESLNCHPHELAELKGSNLKKAVSIERIKDNGYNIHDKMGTILRDELNFLNVKKIREAYKAAFYRDDKEINEALNDKSLLVISGVRNIIIHNASKFDRNYLESIKDIPGAPSGEIGEIIKFDGEIVHNMLGPAASAAAKLLIAG